MLLKYSYVEYPYKNLIVKNNKTLRVVNIDLGYLSFCRTSS